MSTGATTHNSNTSPHTTTPQASSHTTSTGRQREAQQPATLRQMCRGRLGRRW